MATVQYIGTGRRKTSVARVRLVPGTGKITINKRDIDEYFDYDTLKVIVREPLVLTDTLGKYDVVVNVHGGGFTGQAGAIRHGISRALVNSDEELKPILKKSWILNKGSKNEGEKEIRLKESKKSSTILKEIVYLDYKLYIIFMDTTVIERFLWRFLFVSIHIFFVIYLFYTSLLN